VVSKPPAGILPSKTSSGSLGPWVSRSPNCLTPWAETPLGPCRPNVEERRGEFGWQYRLYDNQRNWKIFVDVLLPACLVKRLKCLELGGSGPTRR
jgi:hypothetical protein